MTTPAGPQQGGPRRSRIVVDVARMQAEAEARRRGRFSAARLPRGLKLASVGALAALTLLLLLALGGYLWWQSFRKTPVYSLALLFDAARRGELKEVEGLIDADEVARNFVPQIADKLAAGGGAAPTPDRRQIEAALPALLPRVRETVREEVARGVKGFAEQSGRADTSFPLLALGLRRAADVKEDGDAATVTLKTEGRQTEAVMRRDGARWKVVAVRDDALATSLAARLAGSLPPPPANTPRRRPGR